MPRYQNITNLGHSPVLKQSFRAGENVSSPETCLKTPSPSFYTFTLPCSTVQRLEIVGNRRRKVPFPLFSREQRKLRITVAGLD